MLILGVSVLGNLNTPATSQEELGLAFWRIILSAGILAMVMSVVNIIAVSPVAVRNIKRIILTHCCRASFSPIVT